jgi:hypothetical protein
MCDSFLGEGVEKRYSIAFYRRNPRCHISIAPLQWVRLTHKIQNEQDA